MKLIAFLAFLLSVSAHAVPVLNENGAASKEITLLPDHADAKLFYVAPTVMTICTDSNGVPRFSWQDLPTKFGLHAILQMTLCGRYDEQVFAVVKANVLARTPDARFVALPFASSRVIFDPVLSPYVVKQFCDHAAGNVGDEQTCALEVNVRGRQTFIRNIRDRVTMAMQYEYVVAGFARNADGSLANAVSPFQIAARIGGETLKDHPELFLDQSGRPINQKK